MTSARVEPEPLAFEIAQPDNLGVGFIYNSPHSGRWYPQDLLERTTLPLSLLRSSEDFAVDYLFSDAPLLGAPLMHVHVARAYIDLNREPLELDPLLISGHLPKQANTRSDRVRAGLGTIPRIVGGSRRIYDHQIPLAEAISRISRFHIPIHRALSNLISRTHEIFGHAVLIDCHSMPSSLPRLSNSRNIDIVLGDRFGASCCPELVHYAESFLRGAGLSVLRNRPYAGGYITQNYCAPVTGVHTLQIEINRALYMNEATLELHAGADELRATIRGLMQALHALPPAIFQPRWTDSLSAE